MGLLTESGAGYLYLVTAHFDEEGDEAGWNAWYEEVHIPNLLAVPGVISVARYRRLGRERRYLAVYEIESPAVFDTDAYRAAAGWGPWQASIVTWNRTIAQVVGG